MLGKHGMQLAMHYTHCVARTARGISALNLSACPTKCNFHKVTRGPRIVETHPRMTGGVELRSRILTITTYGGPNSK